MAGSRSRASPSQPDPAHIWGIQGFLWRPRGQAGLGLAWHGNCLARTGGPCRVVIRTRRPFSPSPTARPPSLPKSLRAGRADEILFSVCSPLRQTRACLRVNDTPQNVEGPKLGNGTTMPTRPRIGQAVRRCLAGRSQKTEIQTHAAPPIIAALLLGVLSSCSRIPVYLRRPARPPG